MRETGAPSLGWEGPLEKEMTMHSIILSFPGGSDGKESACNAEDPGSIPGLGKSPGKGNGNPLQCPCLGNPMDRGAWRATVLEAAESDTT